MSDEPRDAAEPTDPGDSGRADPSPGADQVQSLRSPSHRAHSPRHGFLIAGRIAVALVAVLVLTATGWEWAIKSRADTGIAARSIDAIVSDDTNIATATGTVVPPPGSYSAENILLLGSDTRAGAANAAAGGTDASTSDGVANSDSQMVAHISADRQHVTVLSIPSVLLGR